LAKIESGRAEWNVSEVDLREVIGDAIATTSQLFRDERVALEADTGPALPPVRVDRDRLLQVLLNLLSNAVKFCDRPDSKVEIAARVENGVVRVDVRDNGPGISPSDTEKIFEKFRQVGDNLTGKPQGTGLGLPISRQIVEHFGGRLWVESEPGRGSTFSFTLPLRPGPTGQSSPALAAAK
jgi:signal transduction histidine kinase